MSNEQWKEDGKCNICRRKNYCNNRCKVAKERQEYEVGRLVTRTMFKAMGAAGRQEGDSNA